MRCKPTLKGESSAEMGHWVREAYMDAKVHKAANQGLDSVSRLLEEARMLLDEAEEAHARGDGGAFKQAMKQACRRLVNLAR